AGVNVERIPLGVDTSRFEPLAPAAPGPPWSLLHVASLNRVKDQTTLLDAMARLVAHLPEVHLHIVGEDTRNGAVQRRCTALELDGHVSFHGFEPTDCVAERYRRAHLL